MSLALAILPVALLILLMTSPVPRRWLPLPAHHALPLVALLAYALHVAGAFAPPAPSTAPSAARLNAAVIDGLLSALTPMAIVLGAVLFFKTMQRSGAMDVLTARLRRLSPDPVAQLIIVGWAFSFLIEGLSGFGTPAALAAPILVGLGFPPLRVAAMCLVMNSVPVSFGAVGTPVWFGLGELRLPEDDLRAVAASAGLVNAIAALVIPILALRIVLPWNDIAPRLRFVLLVAIATALPYALLARVTVEFPSILGGLAGLLAAGAAARLQLGLPPAPNRHDPSPDPALPRALPLWAAALPILAVVALLAITRIDALGLKALLNADAPAASLRLGVLGEASITPALVLALREILGTDAAWRMPVLYVPFILPFILVATLAVPLLGLTRRDLASIWRETLVRLARPAIALLGALVLVKLLMTGGDHSPAMRMGAALASAAGPLWPALAPLLGALGAFFSGSNTVSNLTFAPVQAAAADALGLHKPTILAMQTVGGALGNMVCVHNIVAVAAVLGIADRPVPRPDGGPPEPAGVGAILRLTAGPMVTYAAIAGVMGLVLARLA